MRRYVSCIKHGVGKDSAYFSINIDEGISVSEIRGAFAAECGELLEYKSSGIINQVGDSGSYLKKIESEIAKFDSGLMGRPEYKTGNDEIDRITGAMWKELSKAAQLIIRKVIFSAPVIVRFHNDADGSSGAYSIYLSLKDVLPMLGAKGNIVWNMQRSVSYGPSDAENDILVANNYSCVERPLLILIDFGTTTDSNMGFNSIKDRFDVVWLDHHPVVEGFDGVGAKGYINPWQFGGDSNYTAGLLSSVLCKTFSEVDTKRFEQASLVSDYSSYADRSVNNDTSTLLDFITSDLVAVYGKSKTNVTPQEIETVLENRQRSKELLNYANMRMEEALDNGMKNLKTYSSKHSKIYVLDFKEIRSEDSKYPLPGRYSSRLLDRILENDGRNAILIVHAGRYISIRLSKGIGDRIDLLDIIKVVKGFYSKSIEAGGGHLYAAGVKISDSADKAEILKAIINRIRDS